MIARIHLGLAIIWACVISVTLSVLAIGYWTGGRIADRRPSAVTLAAGTFNAGEQKVFRGDKVFMVPGAK